ncbi:MAG TPA: hypothetical protein PKU97_18750 [Kofleriaceae bacterium]|nr:hypothetical protein [Kofleriaceae bacterium]
MLLGVFLLLGLAMGCGEPLEDPADPADPANPALSSTEQEVTGCSATNDCLSPYNGVAVTCSGTANCTPTSTGVSCNGVQTSCTRAAPTTCAMNPAASCSSNSTCWAMCGGKGYGFCQTSTACCICY